MSRSAERNVKTSSLMKATQGLVDLLSPLESEERNRAVQAAFVLLGEVIPTQQGRLKTPADDGVDENSGSETISAKAKLWMKQNNIGGHALAQVFHVEGEV